jgi:hypothetical protein
VTSRSLEKPANHFRLPAMHEATPMAATPSSRKAWWWCPVDLGGRALSDLGQLSPTEKTRVPQFRRRSGVWLDRGGTYSVASHTVVPEGMMLAQE